MSVDSTFERRVVLPILFSSTLFLSAFLLFCVQPLVAKILLPLLGGSPGVWNTCMVFFQGALLIGYAYPHLVCRRFSLPIQGGLQAAFLIGAGLLLPIALSDTAIGALPRNSSPVSWLIENLAFLVGLPFVILSTVAPLLQRWFAQSKSPSANDPYYLYAASNCGSLLALVGYPLFIEPNLRLKSQTEWWSRIYWIEAILIVLCALAIMKYGEKRSQRPLESAVKMEPSVSWNNRMVWIFLAFVPSSLMLGVTTYLTTDIASVPLLWVIPLGLYLLTFILVFARRSMEQPRWVERTTPILALGIVFLMVTQATEPAWLLILFHLAFFFFATMLCHGRLAAKRPEASKLTEFYLCLSIGGVLGGIFNALIAPTVFRTVIEYPLAILLACLVRQKLKNLADDNRRHVFDWILPLLLGFLALAIGLTARHFRVEGALLRLLVFGIPLLICYSFMERPLRFTLGLGILLVIGLSAATTAGKLLHVERNFFGVLRVNYDSSGPFHRLYHGSTIHGLQFLDPVRQCEPLSYYHSTGPLGEIFQAFRTQKTNANFGAVGLGAGAVICYSVPGDHWTFYEIDPAVVTIARDTNYFTYLEKCARVPVSIKMGDARLQMTEAAPGEYDVLILDAFSSGVIPMHLITREAVRLYLSKLRNDGLLVFHISSRHLDFKPLAASLARDAGLICLSYDEAGAAPGQDQTGKYASHWVVMSRALPSFGPLATSRHWERLIPDPKMIAWSDDFSNLLSIFRWK